MKHMIDPDTALSMVLAQTAERAGCSMPIELCLGLTLGENVVADRPYPPFDRSVMDGYAVRLADAGRTVPVLGEVAAGASPTITLEDGAAVAVMTGAPCPQNTEAVVPVEDVSQTGNSVALPASIQSEQYIARKGSECAAGQTIVAAGNIISPLTIANLATFGYTTVQAIPAPKCTIIVTGNEIESENDHLCEGQIRDANGPMLNALCRGTGVTSIQSLRACDTESSMANALQQTNGTDIVILSGGVSAGKYDLVPDALRMHGVDLIFHKVTQKPGKPLLFGVRGNTLFFGLPGNPLSCHLGFCRYIAPCIRKMMGRPYGDVFQTGILTTPLPGGGVRTLFQLCAVVLEEGTWRVTPLVGKGSADLHQAARANAYVRIDPGAPVETAGTHEVFVRTPD